MQRTHIVQITADNADVSNGNFAEIAPAWARRLRIQLVASDSDWLFDLSVAGSEYARSCGPHITAADNVEQSGSWTAPHIVVALERTATRRDYELDMLMNVNVVTSGVGVAIFQYES